MGDARRDVIAFAIAASISPIPIIAVVLMLATPRGRTNGPAFIAGWVAGLAVAGAAVLFLFGGGSDNADDSGTATTLNIVLGVLLVLIAARTWRKRPRGDDAPEMPEWMSRVDHFNATRSAALAIVLSDLNPKNLLLVVGAMNAIASAALSHGDELLSLAIFVVIATIGPLIPVAIYFAGGEAAGARLDALKQWLARHNAAIMTVILLAIGVKLLIDGLA
jgi:threonine/homoserine/homoserine lactone efflux protein